MVMNRVVRVFVVLLACVSASSAIADGKNAKRTEVSSTFATGSDRPGGSIGFIGGVLDASGNHSGGIGVRTSDGNETSRKLATQRARIEQSRLAAQILHDRYADVSALYTEYERLTAMTPADVSVAFPFGGYDAHLAQVVSDYHLALAEYEIAQARMNQAQANLTGGTALQGGVLEELNALLGQ